MQSGIDQLLFESDLGVDFVTAADVSVAVDAVNVHVILTKHCSRFGVVFDESSLGHPPCVMRVWQLHDIEVHPHLGVPCNYAAAFLLFA